MITAPLTGLTADVALPAGITAKVYDCQLEEEFREKDSEGFADNGFGNATLTGQRLKGSMVGWLTQNDPGVGTMHSAVPITFTAASGCVIQGSFNITRFKVRLKVGEMSLFTADVASVGPYTKTWVSS